MTVQVPIYKGDPPGLVEQAIEMQRAQGAQARRNGTPREDCPYVEGTLARPGWLDGWDKEVSA